MRYTSEEVARLAGLSYRQVDYLCRGGLLTAAEQGHPGLGPAHPRRFTDSGARLVVTYAALRRLGAERRTLENVGRYLRPLVPAQWTGHLYVDRDGIVSRDRALLAGPALWVLDLDEISARLRPPRALAGAA